VSLPALAIESKPRLKLKIKSQLYINIQFTRASVLELEVFVLELSTINRLTTSTVTFSEVTLILKVNKNTKGLVDCYYRTSLNHEFLNKKLVYIQLSYLKLFTLITRWKELPL
jgi:hypothetical protein